MKVELETLAQLQAKASWRVAVTQGLTLLGFREWLSECSNHPREACKKNENDPVAGVVKLGSIDCCEPRRAVPQIFLALGDRFR